MQFNFQIDPRVGQWLNLVTFVLSALLMASWWQDLLTVKQVAVTTGVLNLTIATINYVLHGMPAPPAVRGAAKTAIAVFVVALLALVLATPGHAQTVTKAAPASSGVDCTLTLCEGAYVGANIVNAGANFDVIGQGLTGLAANGIMGGLQAGYEFWNDQLFAAVEADVQYDVTMNNGGIGSGLSGQYAFGGQVKLGYTLAQLFGAAATGQATPTLPQQLLSSLISPYIAIGVWDRPWGAGLLTGAGVQALIAQNWTLDAEYFHVNYNNAQVNSNTSEQSENDFMLALSRHF